MKKMKEICWLLAIVLLGFIGYYLYQCKVEHTSQIATVKIQGKSKPESSIADCMKDCASDCYWDGDVGSHSVEKCTKANCTSYCKDNATFDQSKYDDFANTHNVN